MLCATKARKARFCFAKDVRLRVFRGAFGLFASESCHNKGFCFAKDPCCCMFRTQIALLRAITQRIMRNNSLLLRKRAVLSHESLLHGPSCAVRSTFRGLWPARQALLRPLNVLLTPLVAPQRPTNHAKHGKCFAFDRDLHVSLAFVGPFAHE